MQIPLIVNWKNFFKDLETYQIWGVCMMNRIYHKQNDINKKTILDMDSYIHELTGSNNKILKTKGINTMTISDITQIPRTTVIRKLQKLIEMKFLIIEHSSGKYFAFNLSDTEECSTAFGIIQDKFEFMVMGWKVAKSMPTWTVGFSDWKMENL